MILDDMLVDEVEAAINEARRLLGLKGPYPSSHDLMHLHRRLTRCVEAIENHREEQSSSHDQLQLHRQLAAATGSTNPGRRV